MPHRDTILAIKQAISRTLDVTQGLSLAIKEAISQALNAKQGHKPSYQTSSLSIYAKYLVTILACMFQ